MDDIESLLARIVTKITSSSRSDLEKADVLAELSVGMRKLIWPILVSHIPEYLLKEVTLKEQITVDEYSELIASALSNPATANDIHDELKAALLEVEALVGV